MNLETVISEKLWADIRQNYENTQYTAAILDAVHHLGAIVREKANLEGDGAQLIGDAFGVANPRIKVTKLKTENDKNIQRGVESLLRGMYQAIRNPRSHEKLSDTQQDADAIIVFIDYLIRFIGAAKSQFSVTEFMPRVLDKDFVPKEQYATLLVRDIPPNKRMDVMLEVLKAKDNADCSKLTHFFYALHKVLEANQKGTVFEMISDELKTIEKDDGIIKLIQLLKPQDWPKIQKVSRLRIENKIIESITNGYVLPSGKCTGGILGTWATRLFPFFTLKNEASSAINNLLFSGNRQKESYALGYLARSLPSFIEKPNSFFQMAMRRKLKEGHKAFYALAKSFDLVAPEWEVPFANELVAFVAKEEPPDEDDVPF
jgi:uncharacterized protein (TIGR02391 family)